MLYVIIALLPTSLFGIYNFGYKALVLILVTIASCVASEWVFNKIVHKKQTIDDLSAVVTGLLLALNLPATLPWWEAVIGGVFSSILIYILVKKVTKPVYRLVDSVRGGVAQLHQFKASNIQEVDELHDVVENLTDAQELSQEQLL